MVNALFRLLRFVAIMATLSAVMVISLVLIAPQAGKLVSAHRSDHEQLDLKPLTEQGLLELTAGEDKRTRMVRLTVQGREAIARAYPLWRQAQAPIVQGSGADRWQLVAGGLAEVAALALRS